MRLLHDLERALAQEQSLFRTQLLKEDIARVKQLQELAETAPSLDAFVRQALLIGWTPGDARTFELRPALEPLLAAFHAACKGEAGAQEGLAAAWRDFEALRMDRLVGCLSRVPRPPREI
jgi:hypothetical protein